MKGDSCLKSPFDPFPELLLRSVSVAQSCPAVCNPMDCSLPGSSVHGILQARILEWVAISSSRGSSWPREWTRVSCSAGRFFTVEESVALCSGSSKATGLVYLTLSWGLKEETRLLAAFSQYAIGDDLFLMMARSMPFGTLDGGVWNLQPRGLSMCSRCPNLWEENVLIASEQGASLPQESQRMAGCHAPVHSSVWRCWLFVFREDGKTMRLLAALVTDIHSGERIWESNSELALFGEFYENAHSFSSRICIPAEWAFSIFLVNMH